MFSHFVVEAISSRERASFNASSTQRTSHDLRTASTRGNKLQKRRSFFRSSTSASALGPTLSTSRATTATRRIFKSWSKMKDTTVDSPHDDEHLLRASDSAGIDSTTVTDQQQTESGRKATTPLLWRICNRLGLTNAKTQAEAEMTQDTPTERPTTNLFASLDVLNRQIFPASVVPPDSSVTPATDILGAKKQDDIGSKETIVQGHGDEIVSADEGDDSEPDYPYEDVEPFEVYKQKVIQLCQDIGYGKPSRIENLYGGSSNRVVALEFPDKTPADCILRSPWMALDEDEAVEILDQVSISQYLSRNENFHAPSIMAFDSTTNNAIERQYVFQNRLPGKRLDEQYYKLPLIERLEITGHVARLIMSLESVHFDLSGRLIGDRCLPRSAKSAMTEATQIAVTGFRVCPISNMPTMRKQDVMSLIIALLQFRKDDEADWPEMVSRCNRLQSIAREMQALGFFRIDDDQNVLYHWDFAPRNILGQRTGLLNRDTNIAPSCLPNNLGNNSSTVIALPGIDDLPKWKITGVLDWDDVLSVPLVLARKPPVWLWFEETDDEYWHSDHEAKLPRPLTAEELLIKAHFDQIMSSANPTYVEDAYHRGRWIRALTQFGLKGFGGSAEWNRYEVFEKEWREFVESTGVVMPTN